MVDGVGPGGVDPGLVLSCRVFRLHQPRRHELCRRERLCEHRPVLDQRAVGIDHRLRKLVASAPLDLLYARHGDLRHGPDGVSPGQPAVARGQQRLALLDPLPPHPRPLAQRLCRRALRRPPPAGGGCGVDHLAQGCLERILLPALGARIRPIRRAPHPRPPRPRPAPDAAGLALQGHPHHPAAAPPPAGLLAAAARGRSPGPAGMESLEPTPARKMAADCAGGVVHGDQPAHAQQRPGRTRAADSRHATGIDSAELLGLPGQDLLAGAPSHRVPGMGYCARIPPRPRAGRAGPADHRGAPVAEIAPLGARRMALVPDHAATGDPGCAPGHRLHGGPVHVFARHRPLPSRDLGACRLPPV